MPRRSSADMIRVLAPFISTTESLHTHRQWRIPIPHADRTYVFISFISSFNYLLRILPLLSITSDGWFPGSFPP
ncbi:hypothetical protein BO78DRAFT_111451 [Aspergillus sclerotiicarbonarius CBS 121057]|uniref:Uncharacterized protein n=1 Tax=Aspergillus sclerotiicarbonarius (strain CBS 121057 / IBT 28362) TaxID=1448318 RepID=A0A319E9I0_ASPSB|nr:hypothetical protein BO78DRAFT_111451 [Aspergillus sclerotiicarbonarius CBS 121057]